VVPKPKVRALTITGFHTDATQTKHKNDCRRIAPIHESEELSKCCEVLVRAAWFMKRNLTRHDRDSQFVSAFYRAKDVEVM